MPKKSLKIALFKFSIEGANMALTTTQVNTAFLAALARPAEGSAATWGAGSLNLDSLLNNIFIAENTEDFVESLYTEFLGRASDAEGKAFWNSLLATTSKEAVLAQFKAAILAAGQADPSNADYQGLIATNKAFVQTLYTNLLGRTDAASADAEGVEFWANALASGTSKGALLAQFTAAALSDPNSDDAQTLNAKVNVANAITAKFNNFNADVTADQKKAALDALKATMTEVVAGSTAEDFQERIDTFAGNYQNRVAQVFTTKDDDQLDASEATASTVFSGNVNLIDSTKGTIQTTDSVAGNSNYTDTLRVSVTSDSANKDFNLTSNLPTSVSSIEKLIVTAGAANVSGTLNGTNYAESANITSTGDVDLKISGDQTELKVTAGDKKDAAITVESGSLTNYVGSAAKDTINVKAGSVKTIDTGAGKDVVTIAAAADIKNEGSIKLGAGDDELTIGATLTKADTLNKISLDGGEGSKDKLTISTDITAVNSITGFETISAATGAKISADAANSLTSGTKLAHGSDLEVDMSGKNSLNLKNLKVGNTTDNKLGEATVDVTNVAKGEVTLTTTTNNAIVETITLKATATDGTTGPVTIKGIGAAKLNTDGSAKDAGSNGDKLAITGMTLTDIVQVKNYNKLPALEANKVYYINTAISSADDLSSKGTVLSFVGDYTKLASGKTLVALNNSAQNKSYIFEIKGTGAKVTRDDITLKAIVDNAINSKDVITAGNEIEFVAGIDEKDVKPAGGDANGKVLAYSGTSIDLSTGTYTVSGDSQETFVSNTQKLIITDISGALAVSNGSKTIDAFVTDASGAVTVNDTATGTVNVYLGGSVDASGAITAGSGAITFTEENTNLAKGATNLYANVDESKGAITLKDAKTFGTVGSELKLDLSLVNADIKFGATANDQAAIDLTTLVTGEDASDKVAVSGGATTTKIVGTKAADTITLGKNTTDTEISVDFGAGGNDTLVATAQKISGSTQKGYILTSNAGSGDKVVLGTTSSLSGDLQKVDAAQTWTTDLKTTLELILAGVSGGSGVAKSVVVGKIEGATGVDAKYNGTYVIYNESADVTLTDNNDIVVFLGNVDLAKVSLDAAAASATGIVIA